MALSGSTRLVSLTPISFAAEDSPTNAHVLQNELPYTSAHSSDMTDAVCNLPGVQIWPDQADYATYLWYPTKSSHPVFYYSCLWGYEVLCHPDSYRNPNAVYTHFALTWLLVNGALYYLLRLRGDHENYLRLLLLFFVPYAAVSTTVGPLVFILLRPLRTFIVELLSSVREHGLRNMRRCNGAALDLARAEWVSVVTVAFSPLDCVNDDDEAKEMLTKVEPVQLGLLLQDGHGRGAGSLIKSVRMSMNLEPTPKSQSGIYQSDLEKSTLSSPGEGEREETPSPQHVGQRHWLLFPAAACLVYLCFTNLYLHHRRLAESAATHADIWIYYMSAAGLGTAFHLTIIAFWNPRPRQIVQKSAESIPEEQKKSPLLDAFFRLGTFHPIDFPQHSLPYSLGAVSSYEILLAIILFNGTASNMGLNDDLIVLPDMTTILTFSQIVVFTGIYRNFLALGANVVLFAVKFTMPRANPRILPTLEALETTLTPLQTWTLSPTKPAFLSDQLYWIMTNWYYPFWALVFYTLLYTRIFSEVTRFNTHLYLRPNNLECRDLWVDPVAVRLLWPIYWICEKLSWGQREWQEWQGF